MSRFHRTDLFSAILVVLAGVDCGPAESYPPNNDAGTNNDAGNPDKPCDGQCVPDTPGSWRGPALLWLGDESAAPLCPENASFEVFTGHTDPDGPPCGACKCAMPSGSCELPSTLTAAAASCAGDGSSVEHTSFNPPASWSGTCTTANAIPPGKLCNGVPCAQSITIAPLTLKQTGCLPIEPPEMQPPLTWKTFARACAVHAFPPACSAAGRVCSPNPPGPEFRTCLHHPGAPEDLDCPSTYPDKHVIYHPASYKCSPCACGVPIESTCTGSIGLFQDDACNAPVGAATAIDATGPKCIDVPPGSVLGGKTASGPNYNPAPCAPSGGAPSGTIFCCLSQ